MTEQPAIGGRAAKDALFDRLTAVARALANGRRAEIIELLAQGERHVEQVAAAIDQSVANTSHHLRTLARTGLVATRRDGTRVYYRLAAGRVYDLWSAMRDVATAQVEDLEQVARGYLGDRTALEIVSREELRRELDDGAVVVIDVRPRLEYDAGHIPGAVSVPPDRLDELLPALPDHREIVAYCRGPYCAYADEAVRWLLARGRRARRLEEGFPEWRRAGGPIERGSPD